MLAAMRPQDRSEPTISARLLGEEGLLRAYPLVALDRSGLAFEDWVAENQALIQALGMPKHIPDRPLDVSAAGGQVPRHGLVGLASGRGCLLAVYAYQVDKSPGGHRVLEIRGPSLAGLILDGMLTERLNQSIDTVCGALGCARAVLRDW